MRRLEVWFLRTMAIYVVLVLSGHAYADCIKAFSLKEAENRLRNGPRASDELYTLGGITRFAGMVLDEKASDVILVGKVVEDLPAVTIDDLVVALRSRILRKEWPLVSIDTVEETAATGLQKVRFGGGIENSQFGQDLLECDVILKRYSLGSLQSIDAVASYRKLYEESARQSLQIRGHPVTSARWLEGETAKTMAEGYRGRKSSQKETFQNRFWYYPLENHVRVTEQNGVYAIDELRVGIRREFLGAGNKDASDPKNPTETDPDAERFANQFTDHFPLMTAAYPLLNRLKALLDLVAISEGISRLGEQRPGLSHLLDHYRVTPVNTPSTYPLVKVLGLFEAQGGVARIVQISGGVELKAVMEALEDGDTQVLKETVITARPHENALSWVLPLDFWRMPNDLVLTEASPQKTGAPCPVSETTRPLGFQLHLESYDFGQSPPGPTPIFDGFSLPEPSRPLRIDSPRIEYGKRMGFRETEGSVAEERAGEAPRPALKDEEAPSSPRPDPETRAKPDPAGVDMSVRPEGTKSDLGSVKKEILKSRPGEESLIWSIPTRK